ncbi:MAG: hypothetical protein QW575_07750 [Thermoproteota archaeon]
MKGHRKKEGGKVMKDADKIKNLIDYWMKHSNEHTENYMKWAVRAADAGNKDLARILTKLYLESKRLNRLFESAKKVSNLGGGGRD